MRHVQRRGDGASLMAKDEKTCPNCGGTGQVHIGKGVYVKCQMCNGRGTVPK